MLVLNVKVLVLWNFELQIDSSNALRFEVQYLLWNVTQLGIENTAGTVITRPEIFDGLDALDDYIFFMFPGITDSR
jgi:hypothetical protein